MGEFGASRAMPEIRQKAPGNCSRRGMALEPVASMLIARTQLGLLMHPKIVRGASGTCPIWGMANPELADVTRRFWTNMVLIAPLANHCQSGLLPGRPLKRLASFRSL